MNVVYQAWTDHLTKFDAAARPARHRTPWSSAPEPVQAWIKAFILIDIEKGLNQS